MRNKQWLVWVGCFLASTLGMSAAYAGGGGNVDGGTIRFAGAVVEPTCSVATMPGVLTLATGVAGALQQNCAAPGAAASESRPFSVAVVHLSGAESDQVLKYFAGYVRAAQASADPVLVTQTYD